VKEPFTMKDGLYDVPQRPGLGVTLDLDFIRRFVG